jgi:nicotinamidase-related amidase
MQARRLLAFARANGLTVVHVRNLSRRPQVPLFVEGSPGAAFVAGLAPRAGEWLVTKSAAGGFTGTELHARLAQAGIKTLIVAGLMTHLAVDSTARDGALLGYEILLPADASATRDLPGTAGGAGIAHDALHRATLAALQDRFADVVTTDFVLGLPIAP